MTWCFYPPPAKSRPPEKQSGHTEKLNTMHANPVIRGLVKHPKNWRWSSWSFYGKGEPGLVRIDV
jgi:hypothetical protein